MRAGNGLGQKTTLAMVRLELLSRERSVPSNTRIDGLMNTTLAQFHRIPILTIFAEIPGAFGQNISSQFLITRTY